MKLLISCLMILVITGCGSGGGGGSSEGLNADPNHNNNGGWLRISEPAANGFVQNDAAEISLRGRFSPPDRPYLGYGVRWTNATTGETGRGSASRCDWDMCTDYNWSALNIPLAMGANSITVEATQDQVYFGRDPIIVTRVVDTTPPAVLTSLSTPKEGAYVDTIYDSLQSNFQIKVQFSEGMSNETINAETLFLKNANGVLIPATFKLFAAGVLVKPSVVLPPGAYQFTVTTGVKDAAGISLAAPFILNFIMNPSVQGPPAT